MPRKTPTLKLDVLGDFAFNPERTTKYYLESLFEDKLFIKPPNYDSSRCEIDLFELENEWEHENMLQLQEEMIENTKRQDLININRIDELYEMQAEIRNRFIKANNFFKVCDEKKKFAESKYSEEKQLHIEFKHSISKYKRNIGILTEFRETLQKVARQYEPYETLIQEVVEAVDYYSSVKECIEKCDALMMTQEEVRDLQHEKLQEIENMRQKLIKLSDEAKLEVLGLNTQLAELERQYGMFQAELLKIEDVIGNTKDALIDHKLTTARILDEIAIIYRFLCRRSSVCAELKKDDIEKQCDFIRDEINMLQTVIQECQKS